MNQSNSGTSESDRVKMTPYTLFTFLSPLVYPCEPHQETLEAMARLDIRRLTLWSFPRIILS